MRADTEPQGHTESIGDPLQGAEGEVGPAGLDPRQRGLGDPDTSGQSPGPERLLVYRFIESEAASFAGPILLLPRLGRFR